MPTSYKFKSLLGGLTLHESHKLAELAGQVKIEQRLLAEIMHAGNAKYPGLDFFLEEKKRDLTVRQRPNGVAVKPGILVDWIEAKMAYTDCLARRITGRKKRDEYRLLLFKDAQKQRLALPKLPKIDRNAHLTSVLFAIHHDEPVWRHKYYPRFKNRRNLKSAAIEAEAVAYVETIAKRIRRKLVERFKITLNKKCRLHVFILR